MSSDKGKSAAASNSNSWLSVAYAAGALAVTAAGLYVARSTLFGGSSAESSAGSDSKKAPAAAADGKGNAAATAAGARATPRGTARATPRGAAGSAAAADAEKKKGKKKGKTEALTRELLLLILEDVQSEMARALQSEPALQIDGALSAEELEDMFTDLSERIDAKVASKHGVTEQSIADACAEFASDDEVSVKLGNLASMQAAFFDKSESGASFQGEVTTELKEKLYEFHVRWQKEVGDMFRSIPELKMQNPSMSDVQIRQFLLTATERKSEEIASDYGWTRDSANQMLLKAVQSDPAFSARMQKLSQEMVASMQENGNF